jgi:hypothetical protein
MSVSLLGKVALIMSGALAIVIGAPAGPVLADNCSSVSDCFFSADGAALVLLATVLSIGLDFVPVVGDVKGVVEGVVGRDIITGQKLSPVERALGMAGMSELKWISRADDIAGLAKGQTRTGNTFSRWAKQDTAWTQPFHARWERRATVRPEAGSSSTANADWLHITQGETKGKRILGGHSASEFLAQPGSRITSRTDPDGYGVYHAVIERDRMTVAAPATKGLDPRDPHTMYPDNWSRTRIEQEISDAFANAKIDPPSKPGSNSPWSGISPSGLKISGYVNPQTGEVLTAFPKRLPDLELPPAGVMGRATQDVMQISDTQSTGGQQ